MSDFEDLQREASIARNEAKDANRRVADLHADTLEAEEYAGKLMQKADAAEQQFRDVLRAHLADGKRAAAAEMEKRKAAGEARPPMPLEPEEDTELPPAGIVYGKEHPIWDVAQNASTGPWLVVSVIDRHWDSPCFVTLWRDLEMMAESAEINTQGRCKVKYIPVRWVQSIREMLVHLYKIRFLLGKAAKLLPEGYIKNAVLEEDREIALTLANTSPPAERKEP